MKSLTVGEPPGADKKNGAAGETGAPKEFRHNSDSTRRGSCPQRGPA